MVAMAQADGTTNQKKWINLNNIHNSKVDIPGELDFAIGIGASDKEGEEDVRFFHVCKNKLHEGEKGKFTALFEYDKCRYEDM